jgi:hypothetical protein
VTLDYGGHLNFHGSRRLSLGIRTFRMARASVAFAIAERRLSAREQRFAGAGRNHRSRQSQRGVVAFQGCDLPAGRHRSRHFSARGRRRRYAGYSAARHPRR